MAQRIFKLSMPTPRGSAGGGFLVRLNLRWRCDFDSAVRDDFAEARRARRNGRVQSSAPNGRPITHPCSCSVGPEQRVISAPLLIADEPAASRDLSLLPSSRKTTILYAVKAASWP